MSKQLYHRIFSSVAFLLIVLTLFQCANPATPTGGPKDETPPMALASYPENYSSNFDDKEMSVRFNEFLQLKDLHQQMLISPPLENKPEIKIKKKSVIIKLDKEEVLKENTTYTIFLGNAVVDLTENNPYLNFEYVFSTGDFVDSLSVKGTVKDAYTGAPWENVSVMLYANENDTLPLDSLPIKVLPNYVAKTDEKGNFSIHNLRNVPYKIFALNDQNGNYLYDLPYEEIAFLDGMIQPYYTGKREFETLDSIARDSLNIPDYEFTHSDLSMFVAIDSTQSIVDGNMVIDNKYRFILKFPSDSFKMRALNFEEKETWYTAEFNDTKDTIDFWLYPNLLDTLEVEFSADNVVLDTIDIVTRKPKRKEQKGGKGIGNLFKKKEGADTVKVKRIDITNNIIGSTAKLKDKVQLDFNTPIIDFKPDRIIWMEDSIVKQPPMYFTDSAKRNFIIDKTLEEKIFYQLFIYDSCFTSLYKLTNDSLDYSFKTKTFDQYGNLLITVNPEEEGIPWIIQLMSGDKVLQEHTITKSELLKYELMNPGTYKLRAIQDVNRNGYWDTGNYAYKRQAEKVVYLETEIELRANWDYEENWNLK